MKDNSEDALERKQNMIPTHLERFTKPIKVLDHGYILLLDVMGDDDTIVQSARVSYAKGTRRTSNDKHLLRYLLRCRHTSPFEQCRIRLEVKLPIFVERQWVRHRTASLNEMSARYSVLPSEFYIPAPDDVRAQSTTNKQGRESPMEDWAIEAYRENLRDTCTSAYKNYEDALNMGVAREIARCLLPINIYTKKVWTCDLHNLFHYLDLRLDLHAQLEIRSYATAIAAIVKEWVPWAWEAFVDYRLEAMTLTRFEKQGVASLLRHLQWSNGQINKAACIEIALGNSGLTPPREGKPPGREWMEMKAKMEELLGE